MTTETRSSATIEAFPIENEWEAEPNYSAYSLIDDAIPAKVPLWKELFVGLDYALLRASPVYYGIGVPRGDGSAVIVLPGFMGSDMYLFEFRLWLRRIGYRAYSSRIGRNWDCLEVSGAKIQATIERAYKETGKPVHLIGHSLGGIIARAVATMNQGEMIASVTTLGSPFRAVSAHPLVLAMGDLIRGKVHRQKAKENGSVNPDCFSGQCSCGMVSAARRFIPESLPQMAIYTKSDGVVDWRYCFGENPDARVTEVKGTHCGLAFNPAVYSSVAKFLHSVHTGQIEMRHLERKVG